jgi:hypothetical protein
MALEGGVESELAGGGRGGEVESSGLEFFCQVATTLRKSRLGELARGRPGARQRSLFGICGAGML